MSSTHTYSSCSFSRFYYLRKTLNKLKRRILLGKRTIIYFNRGYYSLNNYKQGINRYNIVPVFAPKYENTIQKIKENIGYPLEIFNNKKLKEIKKKEYRILKTILIQKNEN